MYYQQHDGGDRELQGIDSRELRKMADALKAEAKAFSRTTKMRP